MKGPLLIMNLKDLHNRTKEIISGVKTIDKLMSDKVDPYIIVDELPIPIQIGHKIIYVGNLNLANEQYYHVNFAKILGNLGMQHLLFEMMSDGIELITYIKTNEALNKDLTKLVIKTILKQQKWYYPKNDKIYKLNKCSWRYMKNYLTKEKLIQMILLIYLYNYDSLGKSLPLVINKMDAGGISETYMYSWLSELAGVSGNFLQSQLPNLSWYNKEQAQAEKEESKKNGK